MGSGLSSWVVQYLHVWISAAPPKLSDSSAWTAIVFQRRWQGDSVSLGKQGGCSVGQHGSTFPSLITTPTGLNERMSRRLKHFALLVLMCLWSNEWSGPSVVAHYLDTEPALRRGRLFSSDKPGMVNVWCHFNIQQKTSDVVIVWKPCFSRFWWFLWKCA